jgi:hypothetical protein
MWRQKIVQNWNFNGKYTSYLSKSDKSGDSKTFVATIVANVATEIMWLDNTVLEHLKATKIWINITKNGKWSSP